MTLTPQTPYIPSTPTDQKTLFTVEVSVVFFKTLGNEGKHETGMMTGVIKHTDELYSVPAEKMKHGETIEQIKKRIIEKHVTNKAALHYSDAVFSGVLDVTNRYLGDSENRVCLIYSAYIPEFSVNFGLEWMVQDDLISALNSQKFAKDHSQIIAKSILTNG